MRIRSLVAVFTCSMSALTCLAQAAPAPQSIESQLSGPFLMLRGMYDGHKLTFDAEGNLVGTASVLPFSLSALRLDKVRVTDSGVEIDTTREGLDFQEEGGTFAEPKTEQWGSGNRLRITIARDARNPEKLNTALAKVFSIGLDQAMIDDAPEYWRPYLEGEAGFAGATPGGAFGTQGPRRPGGAVTEPRLLYAPLPNYPLAARGEKYSGIAVIGLIVDASGAPRDVRVVRPLGMGLDEAAVEAVEHYRFSPAMYGGKPVPVQINIEVDFRMW
jgi:TonB family protein